MGIRTKLSSMGLTNRKKPFTDVMKYTVQVSDNGYVDLPVSLATYTPDTVINIDWGDGSTQELERGVVVSTDNIHQYTTAGDYQISISTKSNKFTDLSFTNMHNNNVISIDSPLLNINDDDGSSLFENTKITTVPNNLFENNKQLSSLRYCFSNTLMQSIPSDLVKGLSNLESVLGMFTDSKINDIDNAASFLQQASEYTTQLNLSCTLVFSGCPFTTSLTSNYANVWYNVTGSLNYICDRWLINSVPFEIINSITDNTSLRCSFRSCAMLETVSLQPLTSSVTNVQNMFDSCDNLTNVSGTLGDNSLSFGSIFRYCDALQNIQDDFIPTQASITDISYMFYSCESLQSVPDTLLKGKNFSRCNMGHLFTDNFFPKSNMFEGTIFSSQTNFGLLFYYYTGTIPSKLFEGCITNNDAVLELAYLLRQVSTQLPEDLLSYFECWLNCNYVLSYYEGTSIPESAFRNLKISSFNYGAAYSSLTELPSKMFENCTFPGSVNFNRAFYQTELVTVPTDLFDGFETEGKTFTFNNCFDGLSTITSAVPELWNRTDMNIKGHTACFRGCVNAANYADIPDDWK